LRTGTLRPIAWQNRARKQGYDLYFKSVLGFTEEIATGPAQQLEDIVVAWAITSDMARVRDPGIERRILREPEDVVQRGNRQCGERLVVVMDQDERITLGLTMEG
jgi:hypothetical protein